MRGKHGLAKKIVNGLHLFLTREILLFFIFLFNWSNNFLFLLNN